MNSSYRRQIVPIMPQVMEGRLMTSILLEPKAKDRKEKQRSEDVCFTIEYDDGCIAKICLLETSPINEDRQRDLLLHRLRRLGMALQDVADSPRSIRQYS